MNSRDKSRRKAALLLRYGNQCKGCRVWYPERELTIDHIIPKARGGSSALGNLQLMCAFCNHEKADRMVGR